MSAKKYKVNKRVVHESNCGLLNPKKDYEDITPKDIYTEGGYSPCPSCKPLSATYLPCKRSKTFVAASKLSFEDIGRVAVEPLLGEVIGYSLINESGEIIIEVMGESDSATFTIADKIGFAARKLQFP